MDSLTEKKILLRMKQRLGEDIPQSLLDDIAEEEASIVVQQEKQQAIQEERKTAFKTIFSDLSTQLGQLMAEEKKKTEEEQALLDRFSSVLSRVDEIKAQIAENKEQTTEEFIEEIIPQTVESIPEEIIETTSIILAPEEPPAQPSIKNPIEDVADKIKVSKPPSMFVQPDPPPVSRDIKDIQSKLKMLEGWVSKISMTGPGGGAVWLRDLDDVARSSILGATDGQVLTYNESIKKWTAQDSASGGSGSYTLPTASTTVKGGVKIDGTTITINDQTISANVPVTDITSIDNTVQISSSNGVHDLSVAASLSTSVDKVFAYVTNDDSVTIHKGDPVYLYRATGNRPSVIQARNTSDNYSAKTLGLASQDINPGNPGWVQTQGVLTGVDTSMYSEGDTLYLGSTAGTLTNVKPYAPNHLVYMGVVVRANQGQGQIYIRPQNGYELEELHNVNIDHNVVLANGHVIVYNATNSLWENRDLSGLVATYTANNASNLGGIAANQYAYANSLSVYQTTAGLSANVATLTSNNTSFVGSVSAANVVSNNQLSSNLANYQTTAGLSANVATLTANNTLYLGGTAANGYAKLNANATFANVTANVITATTITTNTITANAATAFIAGDAAASGIALQMPNESALRNMTNGFNIMYFDVSNGGATHGGFRFRSSSGFTELLDVSTDGLRAISAYKGKTPFNSALDTVVTVDNLKFRISNQGGVFPQVASASGSAVDVCYDIEGVINGLGVVYANNSGYILLANGTWLSVYSSHGMDTRGDRLTMHITDKNAGKIYRATYMKTNNSSNADGYNIIVERIL